MAWIESHQSLATHRKLLHLMRLLKISDIEAVGLLHYLWWWALDNAPEGVLTGIAPEDIASAAHWTGRKHDPRQFIKALIAANFIELTDKSEELTQNSTIILHDWDDYAGKLIDRRRGNAERQRAFRESKKGKSNTLRNDDITVTSRLRNGATVPNPTVPNSTVPKNTRDNGVVLPDFIDKGLWDDFLDMRKKLRKPATDKAITLLLKDLDNYKNAGDDPNEVIKQSIKNSWQGLFPLKAARAGPPKPATLKKIDEGPIEGLEIEH